MIETQDFLFMKCLQEKICKRHVNLEIENKNTDGGSLASRLVINAFDLDEISFLTGLNFYIVRETGEKLIKMNFAKKIIWEDKDNNEDRYLWYLSEKGEEYLSEN